MGKHFGELAFVRGIVYYKLSQHEQKPFAGAAAGIANFVTRTIPTIRYWLPQLVMGILIYTGVEEAYYQSKRKNWRDYLDEVDPDNPNPKGPKPTCRKTDKQPKDPKEKE